MNVGRRDYAERRAARVTRLEARAAGKSAEAQRLFTKNDALLGVMNGTPVLRGHHSEGRHRRDLARIDNDMRKSFEASKDADRLARAASAAESNTAISSDDPEAVAKLTAKLERLQAAQERMKLVNGLIRKHAKAGPDATRAALLGAGISPADVAVSMTPDSFGKLGFPGYALSGGTAEMTRVKKRIADLEARAALPDAEFVAGDVRVLLADNRVQIVFPGKPDEATRKELRSNGFVWAPSVGAWQRKPSQWAWDVAKRLAQRVDASHRSGKPDEMQDAPST
jgi:hypothetical protein